MSTSPVAAIGEVSEPVDGVCERIRAFGDIDDPLAALSRVSN
jgi:hypothetical protein